MSKTTDADDILGQPLDGSKVSELKTDATKRRATKKWGVATMNSAGYCILPSILIRGQARLGLSPNQFAVLIHLADMWWEKSRLPFSRTEELAKRMGMSGRNMQRIITDLEKGGFLTRVVRIKGRRGQISNEFDLSGLVERLKALAPEFEEAKKAKLKVEKPGAKIMSLAKTA